MLSDNEDDLNYRDSKWQLSAWFNEQVDLLIKR